VVSLPEKFRINKDFSAFSGQDRPLDLILIAIWLVAGVLVIYLPVLNTLPVRYVITLPLLLFMPGYCFIAALFSKVSDISLIERVALSFGFSFALVSLIGLVLNFTPWGIRLNPIVLSLTGFTLLMILVAYYRRANLPTEERFNVPFHALERTIHQELLPPGESKINHFLSVVLVLTVLVAILTTGYVIVFPQEGERFSELYILGENRTADDYPASLVAGHNYPMYIGVGNYEHRNITYTVETWMTREEFDNRNNLSSVKAMDLTDRLSFALGHNEIRVLPVNLSVEKTGYNRVEFLLFNDSVPGPEVIGSDRINASYRNVNLWITVQ
jgi:uncharacterized membrane protein